MRKVLPRAFFDRSTVTVARELLGKYIVSGHGGDGTNGGMQSAGPRTLMITETEAYDGPRDLASHASRGMTPRTEIMFGEAGVFYVYFIYGMYWMANIVTGPRDYPAAVLFRAGAYADSATDTLVKIKGPGLFAHHLGITGADNKKAALRRNGLWFEDRGITVPPRQIAASKRIGVDYAGPIWSAKRYNFTIKTPSLPSNPADRRGTL